METKIASSLATLDAVETRPANTKLRKGEFPVDTDLQVEYELEEAEDGNGQQGIASAVHLCFVLH
jgi:hypothetical protein